MHAYCMLILGGPIVLNKIDRMSMFTLLCLVWYCLYLLWYVLLTVRKLSFLLPFASLFFSHKNNMIACLYRTMSMSWTFFYFVFYQNTYKHIQIYENGMDVSVKEEKFMYSRKKCTKNNTSKKLKPSFVCSLRSTPLLLSFPIIPSLSFPAVCMYLSRTSTQTLHQFSGLMKSFI